MRQTTSGGQLRDLALAAQTLGPTSDQSQFAINAILNAIRKFDDAYNLGILADAVHTLGPILETDSTQVAVDTLLSALRQARDPRTSLALGRAIHTLAPKLAPQQTERVLKDILADLPKTFDQ